MASSPPTANHFWVQDFFKDHPKLLQKAAEAYSGTRGTHNKAKVFCKWCLDDHVNKVLTQDAREVENGSWQIS